ncbi:NlpC/P60 family protein, partial [Pseudonocardia acidicola]
APVAAAAPALVTSEIRTVALSAPAAAVGGAVPAIARASAVQNALGKLGAPYRWGATGPSAFDCSGLVKWAFAGTGISLPRTSRAMSAVGTPVSKADLRPGDLVFFYRPVSHVAIYIGNGKVVHASTAGQPVKISDMNRMPFNSARRV